VNKKPGKIKVATELKEIDQFRQKVQVQQRRRYKFVRKKQVRKKETS